MSTLDSTAPPVVTDSAAAAFRRAARWLVGTALGGLVAVAAVVTVEITSGMADAAQQAADRLGVEVDDLPADVVAQVHGDRSWAEELLLGVPLALVAVLFLVAVRATTRAAGPGGLGPVADVLGTVCAASWIATIGFSGLVEVQRLAVQHWVATFVIVTVAAGGAAVAALAVLARRRGLARRTGAVVAVLGVLAVIACFTLPPVTPFLLGGVLGAPLLRARATG